MPHWEDRALYGAETETFWNRSEDLESFEMWCWRRVEKIIWTGRMRSEV